MKALGNQQSENQIQELIIVNNNNKNWIMFRMKYLKQTLE